jgi:CelD/BcsL family acetyltransferase involved in cellulose biosynthesis
MAMTARLPWRAGVSRARAQLVLTVVDDLAEIEVPWRRLEADGITTPFQTFAWVRAYAKTLAAAHGRTLRAVVAGDGTGEVCFIAPLEMRSRLGARVATLPGGAHANVQMPLLSRAGSRLPPGEVRRALVSGTKSMQGVDAIHMSSQPTAWSGHPNPFAAEAMASGERLHSIDLDPDPEETLNRVVGSGSRKKLRQKRRRLEALGPVTYRQAGTAEAVDAVLEAFFAQKAQRMRALGIPNPFVGATRDFLRDAARVGERGRPAVDLHALMLDSRIIAVFGAATDARSVCGMFNSFDPDPGLLRTSVGDLLLVDVLRHYARSGRRHFDLGLGEAAYKDTFCERADPVVETIIPLTAAGVAYAVFARARLVAKRAIKRHPALLSTLRRFST